MKTSLLAAVLLVMVFVTRASLGATVTILAPAGATPTFSTNLTDVSPVASPGSLTISGYHDPSISTFALPEHSLYAVIVLVPGDSGAIRDIITFQGGEMVAGGPAGLQQRVDISFIADSGTGTISPPADATIVGSIVQDGTLQLIPYDQQYAFLADSIEFSVQSAAMSLGRPTPATAGPVPLPAAAWMGLTLLGGLGVKRNLRRLRKSN